MREALDIKTRHTSLLVTYSSIWNQISSFRILFSVLWLLPASLLWLAHLASYAIPVTVHL